MHWMFDRSSLSSVDANKWRRIENLGLAPPPLSPKKNKKTLTRLTALEKNCLCLSIQLITIVHSNMCALWLFCVSFDAHMSSKFFIEWAIFLPYYTTFF